MPQISNCYFAFWDILQCNQAGFQFMILLPQPLGAYTVPNKMDYYLDTSSLYNKMDHEIKWPQPVMALPLAEAVASELRAVGTT